MRVGALAVVVWLVAGCSSDEKCGETDVAASYQLSAPGISVEITTAPFAVRVSDGAGTVVVESLTAPDGYAPATWTTGIIETEAFPSPGYFSFQTAFDGWHDLELVGVQQRAADSIDIHLHDKTNDDACVTVTYSVRESTLRVEAIATPGTPRAWSTGFASPSDEAFLGFGERFNKTNQRGVQVFSYLEEGGIGTGEGTSPSLDNPYPIGEAMAYYPVPFFISTRGRGPITSSIVSRRPRAAR